MKSYLPSRVTSIPVAFFLLFGRGHVINEHSIAGRNAARKAKVVLKQKGSFLITTIVTSGESSPFTFVFFQLL